MNSVDVCPDEYARDHDGMSCDLFNILRRDPEFEPRTDFSTRGALWVLVSMCAELISSDNLIGLYVGSVVYMRSFT